ncbi:hypothetical protein SK128_015044 [Halocaridina rubra]|uniref:Uncharacterized protein n=1 Tax=Halocaridina rubra TaxID=373956 RepID=A0AAN8XL43_HALRR
MVALQEAFNSATPLTSLAIGERVEKGAASFDECEEYVRKVGDPQPQSSRFEHFENMLNYYVFPPRQ